MLTCITCSKQKTEEEEGGGGTPSTKEAVKSLTSQIKDMAVKMSGAYKQCKPCTGSSNYKKGQRHFPDFETISEGIPYQYGQPGSSSSTPAWDFTTTGHPVDSRFARDFSGDQTPGGLSVSARSGELVPQGDDEPKEWMAQVEPGVQITFLSLPHGGNDLKRIRFCREMFNKSQAQRWWGENYDRIMELYNVQKFNRQALHTPSISEDERDSSYSRLGSFRETSTPRSYYKPPYGSQGYFPPEPSDLGSSQHYPPTGGADACGSKFERPSMDASRTTTSSRDRASVSISNASDMESEWVEQDEPGVYITIRQWNDGTRELRRVRFSREKFGEGHAKIWWEKNRERIQAQYL